MARYGTQDSGHSLQDFGSKTLGTRYTALTAQYPVGRSLHAVTHSGAFRAGTVERIYFGRDELFHLTIKSKSGVRFDVLQADVKRAGAQPKAGK